MHRLPAKRACVRGVFVLYRIWFPLPGRTHIHMFRLHLTNSRQLAVNYLLTFFYRWRKYAKCKHKGQSYKTALWYSG